MRHAARALLVSLLPVLACSPPSEPGSGRATSAQRAPAGSATAQAGAADAGADVELVASSPGRRDAPLPAFSGVTLSGDALDVSSLIGKRFVLILFDPDAPEAAPAAEAITRIAPLRARHNFRIVGVATGARAAARALVEEHALDFPVLDDAARAIARRLGLRAPVAILIVDAEGYVIAAHGGFPAGGPEAVRVVERALRDSLRLPAAGDVLEPLLGTRPTAPDFKAVRLGGGELFELSKLRGRPLVLIFFLHTCPHCHHALQSLRESLGALPAGARPELVGVSLVNRPAQVRERLEAEGLDFFPVLLDPDSSIAAAYGGVSAVPVTFLIDAQGRIAARVAGWRDDRDPPLMRMRLARLAGQPAPMLLHPTGYSGNEFCVTCHESQNETWLLTRHASAFQTLVTHGAERDPECVGCHVVGFSEPGGYTISPPTPHLEDVGCETCHGRGGPHLSPAPAGGGFEARCVTCHDAKHSLGFEYAEFLPRVSHAANAQLAALSVEEKRRLLESRRRPRESLLPATADYVGSEACASCHAAEHATWSESPHAGALATLERAEQAGSAECLTCHTTAYGRPGGFPAGGTAETHPSLAGVGCESCHGPGGAHVGADAPKTGTIVSLGDKCDSCVILQICGTCHDDANDPGFEFEVLDKIEAQRHGTIEPGAGRSAAREALGGPGGPAAAG